MFVDFRGALARIGGSVCGSATTTAAEHSCIYSQSNCGILTMGSIEVFNVQLSGFHGTLPLACSRDFEGSYFLESGNIKVRLERPQRLANNYQSMFDRIMSAENRKEQAKPGPAWSHSGGIEFGLDEYGAVYVQIGTLRISLNSESTERFGFALGQFCRDWKDVCRAGEPRVQLAESVSGIPLPDFAIDELWDPVTGRRRR
jgi:hypothetical protein